MTATNGCSLETVPLLINGKPRSASPSVKFPVYSLEQRTQVYLAESADVDAANEAADASWNAFKDWKKASGVTRRRLLLKYADLLRQHEEELVASQRLETSVIEMWARKNVHLAADLIEEIAACVTRLSGELPQSQTPRSMALAFTVPVGPVLSIAPYITLSEEHIPRSILIFFYPGGTPASSSEQDPLQRLSLLVAQWYLKHQRLALKLTVCWLKSSRRLACPMV